MKGAGLPDLARNMLHVDSEINQAVPDPAQAVHDGVGDHPVKPRIRGHLDPRAVTPSERVRWRPGTSLHFFR